MSNVGIIEIFFRVCLHFAVHAGKKYCRPFNVLFWLLMQSVYPLYVNKGQKLLESEKKKKLVCF